MLFTEIQAVYLLMNFPMRHIKKSIKKFPPTSGSIQKHLDCCFFLKSNMQIQFQVKRLIITNIYVVVR